jgi:tol-pal system protein YbgF
MLVRPLFAVALALSIALPAHAQLFGGDDEARKAILQIREQIKVLQQRETEMTARLDRMESAQRNQLELVNQLESLRQENARLRGQVETLTNEVATLQKRNRDLYADLDARLKKMEPQSVTVDGRSAAVDRAELAAYEAPLAQFRAGDFKGSLPGFQQFVARYPASAYAPAAQYWIGSAHYAIKDYKSAIAAHRVLVERYAGSPRVPDALLSIAESQVQLGDRKSANATLNRVIKEFPETEAAKIARERLPGTR